MKILSFATLLSQQGAGILDRFKGAKALCVSPLDDDLAGVNASFIRCEMGAVGWAILLLGAELFKEMSGFADLDAGELSGESNVGEEEIPLIASFAKECDYIVVSEDIFSTDERVIKGVLSLISQKYGAKIIACESGEELDFSEFSSVGDGPIELEPLLNYDGAVVFLTPSSNSAKLLLKGGPYFKMAAKIAGGQKIKLNINGDIKEADFIFDPAIKGTVGFLAGDLKKYGFVSFDKIKG